MWFSEEEWHPGVTGVFPGRGLGKGHCQRWLRLEPRLGFREVLGEAAQSHGHKAERMSVCVGTEGQAFLCPLKVTVTKQSACVCVDAEGQAFLCPLKVTVTKQSACVCVDAEGQACVLFRSSLGPPREWAVIRRFVLLLP